MTNPFTLVKARQRLADIRAEYGPGGPSAIVVMDEDTQAEARYLNKLIQDADGVFSERELIENDCMPKPSVY